jgi:hypothetical protein
MRVETVQPNGPASWAGGLVGPHSERFRKVTLTNAHIERLVLIDDRQAYVVTNCSHEPQLQDPIPNPARLDWNEVTKVAHYYLSVNATTKPMVVREPSPPFGGEE